jgi:hypothetical protein
LGSPERRRARDDRYAGRPKGGITRVAARCQLIAAGSFGDREIAKHHDD